MIAFRTVSNKRIDLNDPQPGLISIGDIACGLARICRYGGQMREFYSVAQHALLVAALLPKRIHFPAINHDNSEAVLGDVSRHLKHSSFMVGYRELEDRWTKMLDQEHGIHIQRPETRAKIKAADDLAAIFEHFTFRLDHTFEARRSIDWALDTGFVTRTHRDELLALVPGLPKGYVAWSPWNAERQFLRAYAEAWRPATMLHPTMYGEKPSGGFLW